MAIPTSSATTSGATHGWPSAASLSFASAPIDIRDELDAVLEQLEREIDARLRKG